METMSNNLSYHIINTKHKEKSKKVLNEWYKNMISLTIRTV